MAIYLTKKIDGKLRGEEVETESQAVALEFNGWARTQKAAPVPPEKPARPSSSTPTSS